MDSIKKYFLGFIWISQVINIFELNKGLILENKDDKLIRIEQVLSELGIKKTNLYELIKLLRNAIDDETNQDKINELYSIYILIKPKKFGRTSLWSYNQIQQLIIYIKNEYIEEILEYIKYKNAA